ncbi:MAG: methionyl-tRNA formyltransferase [Nitratiruptor sp.]|nr:methionyl-tRNA formyltransferase [Nitratiruptor sp.]NPA84010.1 methionyl-tRNA formyltransferase [Campylobacterota bacterium]
MRILFMGTPHYALTIFKAIEDRVVALFTQPDRPVGRHQRLTPPPIKEYVQKRGLAIPIYQPATLRDPALVEEVKGLRPDFIVVAAYGHILPPSILDIAPAINLHASLLPKYRGASPIQQTLLNGDTITGVTAIRMNERLDAGDILGYEVTPIAPEETAIELFERMAHLAARLTPAILDSFATIAPIPQFDVDATYCSKITKRDGLISFQADAVSIYNRYRAFILWPGIFLESGLKLRQIALHAREGEYEPGVIVALREEGIVVGCARGALMIKRVQPPSKREMGALEYIRGRRLGVGDPLL